MARLVHLGGAVMDYVYRVPGLPERAAELTATACERVPGGAVNMMVAARRTGLATACGNYLGTGADGDALRTFLAKEDIAILLPPMTAIDSGNCVVLVTPDAERSFVSWPGAESLAADLSSLRGAIHPGDVVAVTGYVLSYRVTCDAVLDLVESLRNDVSVVFDPTPVIADVPREALARILARATWMSANTKEIAAIGEIHGGPADPPGFIETHMPRAEGIVLRDGERGARWISRDGSAVAVPGFAVEADDTNGAGDTHVGAFVSARVRGMAPEVALSYANAASAIAVTRQGGSSGPTHDEIVQFIEVADRNREAFRPGTDKPTTSAQTVERTRT